jgi:hypothetical protein
MFGYLHSIIYSLACTAYMCRKNGKQGVHFFAIRLTHAVCGDLDRTCSSRLPKANSKSSPFFRTTALLIGVPGEDMWLWYLLLRFFSV